MDIGDRSPPSQAGDAQWVEVREVQGGKHTVESVLGGRGEAGCCVRRTRTRITADADLVKVPLCTN